MNSLSIVMLAGAVVGAGDDVPKQAAGLHALVEGGAEGRLQAWEFTDPNSWRVTKDMDRDTLEQYKASEYQPKVRSPFNIAWLRGTDVTDFVLDLMVQSTARDYGHRDVCLFFGRRDDSHFYYVHLAKEADEHAHSVFLVDGKDRVSIAEDRTKGVDWTDGWHHVRLVRKASDGLIQVYFDDMDKPIMTAHDKAFTQGLIGVGTFDDTARFRSIRLWGAKP
jgi:hypothetical protein